MIFIILYYRKIQTEFENNENKKISKMYIMQRES